jgi:hypothetical protein
MRHRILPQPRAPQRVHPLHRLEFLIMSLVAVLLLLLAVIVFSSRLFPTLLTGQASNGSVATSVNITGYNPFECNRTLPQGTSLASFPCVLLQISRQDFFLHLSGSGASVQAIYRYTPASRGKWQVYNVSLPNYTVQSLRSFARTDALYFVMSGEERFAYPGVLPVPTNVQLRQGWNLVGYPSNTTKPVGEALSNVNDTYILVRTLEGTLESGSYLSYARVGGGTLSNMTLYNGYWLWMSAADTWVVS